MSYAEHDAQVDAAHVDIQELITLDQMEKLAKRYTRAALKDAFGVCVDLALNRAPRYPD